MDDRDGTGHPTARGDGTASLCPTCGDCRITVRLDVSQVTQICTKLREATGAGRQPTGHLGGDRPAPPPPPAAATSTDTMRDAIRTIGLRLQRIRVSRNKSLRVIAGLAGMSRSTLHRIEHGQRELTLSEIVALAGALRVAPAKLITLPIFASGHGHTDVPEQAGQARTP